MGNLNLRGRVRLSAPMYHKLELAREVEEPKVEEPKVEDHELVRELKEQTQNLSERLAQDRLKILNMTQLPVIMACSVVCKGFRSSQGCTVVDLHT